jgi:hypothetical protein
VRDSLLLLVKGRPRSAGVANAKATHIPLEDFVIPMCGRYDISRITHNPIESQYI